MPYRSGKWYSGVTASICSLRVASEMADPCPFAQQDRSIKITHDKIGVAAPLVKDSALRQLSIISLKETLSKLTAYPEK